MYLKGLTKRNNETYFVAILSMSLRLFIDKMKWKQKKKRKVVGLNAVNWGAFLYKKKYRLKTELRWKKMLSIISQLNIRQLSGQYILSIHFYELMKATHTKQNDEEIVCMNNFFFFSLSFEYYFFSSLS